MKTIGLLGGMSWESTASYYRALNEGIKAKLGGLHSAKICLVSVDFHEIERLQMAGDWEGAGRALAAAAARVEAGGADFLLLCTNTMHKVAETIQAATSLPLLHIADATAAVLQAEGVTRVGLLGTRFTMEEDFYRGRIQEGFGIEVLVPDTEDQQRISAVIYDELCLGAINGESRDYYLRCIDELAARGAQGIILGCTEIALLVQQSHTHVPLYDTTSLHAAAAVRACLTDD